MRDRALPDGADQPLAACHGRLVLVVGPSGAGKDTLIEQAQRHWGSGGPIVIARRIVTRPASTTEDHDTLEADAFAAARDAGRFALSWNAHGLDYGIPVEIDAALAGGATVICNVSRGIIGHARDRYPDVRVIYVDAPLATRMARIAGRARPGEGAARARREQEFTADHADIVIDNGGQLDAAVAAFIAALHA